jgi:uncharacterized membrane protein
VSEVIVTRFDIYQYLVVFGVFLAIDAVWLTNAGRHIYVPEIGALLRDRPNLAVAFLFYAIYALGLLFFIVRPSLAAEGISQAILYGAFFGFVAYATYDLTNLSTLKGFTTKIALIDLAWGTFLSAAVSGVSVWLIRLLKLSPSV